MMKVCGLFRDLLKRLQDGRVIQGGQSGVHEVVRHHQPRDQLGLAYHTRAKELQLPEG